VVASWTDDSPPAVTQRVRHGCQRSRHATGVSRGLNTSLSLSTLTARAAKVWRRLFVLAQLAFAASVAVALLTADARQPLGFF
jgi:hypothetical protein